MFVITADQRGSRSQPDRVDAALRLVGAAPLVRPFERTAGDELQGVADDPAAALGVVLLLVRDGHWSVGVGVGGVRTPLPEQTRAGAGEAFERARVAVTRAKARPDHVAWTPRGPTPRTPTPFCRCTPPSSPAGARRAGRRWTWWSRG